MSLETEITGVFQRLACTSKSAEKICKHALDLVGITTADLDAGFMPDPQSKPTLRILAKPGLTLRLTRNLGKQRGFANGAVCRVVESLDGNAYFSVRLLSNGMLVLVHPIEEDGACFCYRVATVMPQQYAVHKVPLFITDAFNLTNINIPLVAATVT